MIVTGIFLKANQARIITLSGARDAHQLIDEKFNKLELPKNPTREDVDVFVQAFNTYCAKNKIEKIIINRRATSGKGAGGAGSFLHEGVLLATSKTPIEFVHPATVRATDRRDAALKTDKPSTVDLGKAYDIAFEGLGSL